MKFEAEVISLGTYTVRMKTESSRISLLLDRDYFEAVEVGDLFTVTIEPRRKEVMP